jgi:hypothetical protein
MEELFDIATKPQRGPIVYGELPTIIVGRRESSGNQAQQG